MSDTPWKTSDIPDIEILSLIESIESGAVTLTPDRPPAEIWAGDVVYRASNGWTVEVFNDCGEWDYFNAFRAPDGRRVEYEDLPAIVQNYRPDPDVERRAYGEF